MAGLKWTDADEIGFQLSEAYPHDNPLTLRFTELHKRVVELPDFDDVPTDSSEGLLEAIQMAWLDYVETEMDE